MIITSCPINYCHEHIREFLYKVIKLNTEEINLGFKMSQLENAPLPIILLNYGIISIDEFDQIINHTLANPEGNVD